MSDLGGNGMTIERLRAIHEAAEYENDMRLVPQDIVTEHNTYAALLDVAESAQTYLDAVNTWLSGTEDEGGFIMDEARHALRAALDRLDKVAP